MCKKHKRFGFAWACGIFNYINVQVDMGPRMKHDPNSVLYLCHVMLSF